MSHKNILTTPLQRISVDGGDVKHIIKDNDIGFAGFGEAYLSEVSYKKIKGWKLHKLMTLNLVCLVGDVRFVLLDDRHESYNFKEILLSSTKDYCRLTVPPMIWFAFQGLSKPKSSIINIASHKHDPDEVVRKKLNQIPFVWSEIK